MTATTGRTVLAIVAILSLLLSAFAIARPVIASHEPPDGPEVIPTAEEFGGGNPVCPAGSVGYRFNNPEAEDSADVLLADGSTATVTILSVDGNQLTFEVEGGLAAIVTVKGGVSSPGTPDQNVYDYTGFAGGGIAHDDGLTTPNVQGISHVDFCLVPVEASILIYKTDQTGADVTGAEFTVYDGETVVAGPASTDADGLVCFDGLVLDKDYTVTETDAPDGYIGDPNSQTVAASLGNCEDRIAAGDAVDATFTNTLLGAIVIYKTDQTGADVADAIFTVEGKEGTFTTDADGTFCVDGLVVGDTVTVTETEAPEGYELASPASQEVVVTQAGDCDDHDGTPDATFTNNLLGSLLVLKTDDGDPAVALEGAEFTITGPGEFETTATSDTNGWFCLDGLTFGEEYTVTETAAPDDYVIAGDNPQSHTIDDSATCEDRIAGEPVADLVFVNEEEEEPTGSITIVKEIECEVCETLTIGYWFNAAGSHDEHTNSLMTGGVEADGQTFHTADDVRAYIAADISGDSDGQPGLSARGQLTIQYLAALLNVLNNGEDCELAERVFNDPESPFDGWTVGDILAEAEKAFAGTSSYSDEEIKDALDAINNSTQLEENPLTCNGTASGTLDGVEFTIYLASEYPDGDPLGTGTTGDDGAGTVVFDGLTIGEDYVIVETGFPAGITCEIVGVSAPGELIEGAIHVSLTEENLDESLNLTLTVENDCEEEQEEELGSLLIAKTDDDAEEPMLLGGAVFEVDEVEYADTDEDGFVCVDGLTLGAMVAVEETMAPDGYIGQVGVVDVPVTSTDDCETRLAVENPLPDADVVFINELEEELGEFEIDKIFCTTAGEDRTDVFVFPPQEPEPLGILNEDEDDALCEIRDGVEFTITGEGGFELPITVDGGTSTFPHPVGEFVITEESTGAFAEYTIFEGELTAVLFINYEGEEEAEEGLVKIIKLACTGTDDGVVFTVLPGDQDSTDLPAGAEDCDESDATFQLDDGTDLSVEFTVGDDGIRLVPVTVGTYTLHETDPYEGESASFEVTDGGIVTIIVFNLTAEGQEGEGEQPGGGTTPGGEGTLGGNPLPNTATAPVSGSVPAALLALVMLTGLGAAGYAMQAEARRRR